MTDPNVIEAMNLLSAAVCSLATKGLSHKPSDAQHAIDLADEASELLAAAEKPAEKPAEAAPVAPALPWVVRRISNGEVIAHCAHGADARYFRDALYTGHVEVFEPAAAPTVAAVAADFAEERERWLALADKWQADPSLDGNAAFEAGVMAVIGRVRSAAKALAAVGRGP